MESRPKILIIDDEPEFAHELAGELAGYDVNIAGSRTDAQGSILRDRYDLVVLGTLMPRGDAFVFHHWLRSYSRFDDIGLLIIDAPPERQLVDGWSKDEGMRLDADDYLMKPVDAVRVAARVERLLDRASRRIRVLVVDDHATVRDGIRELLTLQRDIQVVGEAVNGQEALQKVAQLAPDVVLMDIVMPIMNGLEATKQLGRQQTRARVLMLSQYDDEANVAASTAAGAWGFVSKADGGSKLLEGIRSVDQGKKYVTAVAS